MDYSNVDNVNILVTLLKENGIKDLVISPGGTNIPIIKAVQDDNFFNCYSVVDERSAAYVAIGIYLQKKHPVALICTSAQATRNYIPGLTEAFYKRVPLLAVTMEKHPRFKYQEYMQAPDQTSLPKDSVKKSFELPFVSDINDYYHSLRLVNEAILELDRNGRGPVQLCIPWLDFSLADVKKEIKAVRRFDVKDIENEELTGRKILLLIGEHIPFTDREKRAINKFCDVTDSIVYTNHLSNFHNDYTVEANLLLLTSTVEEIEKIRPDIIISVGGQTGDYPFYLIFSSTELSMIEHWRICDDGRVIDTYDKLTRIYQGDFVDFFSLAKGGETAHGLYECWNRMIREKTADVSVPFSSMSIAQQLHDKLPSNSIVQFSILNSLRVWNFFRIDSSIECYSNVGAFGIDGGMSTLIGQSIASNKKSFMIIGDLAFLYDMNCLSLRNIKNNVRILLINNNGGVEFKLYTGKSEYLDRYIAAANYRGAAKGWAESCGFKYLSAKSMDEFENVIEEFVGESDKPLLLEAFVSDVDESVAYLEVIRKNRNHQIKDYIKSGLRLIKSTLWG